MRSKDPMTALNSIRLLKDCLDTQNTVFASRFQDSVVPQLEEIAMFKYQDKQDDRGKQFYSSSPGMNMNIKDKNQALYGNSLLRIVLEGITVWAKWYPVEKGKPTKIYQLYAKLRQLNVKFPEFKYFDPVNIKKLESPQYVDPMTQEKSLEEQKQKNPSGGQRDKSDTVVSQVMDTFSQDAVQQQPQVSQFKQQAMKEATKRAKPFSQSEQQRRFDQLKQQLQYGVDSESKTKYQFLDNIQQAFEALVELNQELDLQLDDYLEDHEDAPEIFSIIDPIADILTKVEELKQDRFSIDDFRKLYGSRKITQSFKKPLEIIDEYEVPSGHPSSSQNDLLSQQLSHKALGPRQRSKNPIISIAEYAQKYKDLRRYLSCSLDDLDTVESLNTLIQYFHQMASDLNSYILEINQPDQRHDNLTEAQELCENCKEVCENYEQLKMNQISVDQFKKLYAYRKAQMIGSKTQQDLKEAQSEIQKLLSKNHDLSNLNDELHGVIKQLQEKEDNLLKQINLLKHVHESEIAKHKQELSQMDRQYEKNQQTENMIVNLKQTIANQEQQIKELKQQIAEWIDRQEIKQEQQIDDDLLHDKDADKVQLIRHLLRQLQDCKINYHQRFKQFQSDLQNERLINVQYKIDIKQCKDQADQLKAQNEFQDHLMKVLLEQNANYAQRINKLTTQIFERSSVDHNQHLAFNLSHAQWKITQLEREQIRIRQGYEEILSNSSNQ